ncbi:MAG TPA: threonine/serine exporter family protein [Bacilli bacterium]|nr:threonine/serine exporter family protein [Bacilli bacterium]
MENRLNQALEFCLRAGEVMLINGAETSRIEETVSRFGRAFGLEDIHSFVIPTGIFISLYHGEYEKTGMVRVKKAPSINLNIVHRVNDLSRRFERGVISMEDVEAELHHIETSRHEYRLRYQHIASAVAAGAFTVLFGGGLDEFLLGAVCGLLSNAVTEWIGESMPRFLRTFFAALIGVLVAVVGVNFGWASQLEAAIIGAVIPLVPGVAITNSVRDLMAGELLSGISRGSEALLTAFAIAVAVALVLSFGLQGFMGGGVV